MNEEDNVTDIRHCYDGRPEKLKERLPMCPGSPKPSESQVFRGARPKNTAWQGFSPSSSTSCKAPASKIRKTCSDSASERYTIHGTYNCGNKKTKHVSSVMRLSYGYNTEETRVTKDPLKFPTLDDNKLSFKKPITYLSGKTSICKTLANAYRSENNRHFPLQNHAMISLFVETGEPGLGNMDNCSRIQSEKDKEVIELMRYISTMEDLQESEQNSRSTVENTEEPEGFLDENIENREESGDKYIDGREESDVENFQNRKESDKNVENREKSENRNIKNREESENRNIKNREEYYDKNTKIREESDDRNIENRKESDKTTENREEFEERFENYVEPHRCKAHQTSYISEESETGKEEDINLKNSEEYTIGSIGEYTVVNIIEPALDNHSEPTAETDVPMIDKNLRSSAYENFSIETLESLSEPSCHKRRKGNVLRIPKGPDHKNGKTSDFSDCKETIHNSFQDFRRPVLLRPSESVSQRYVEPLLDKYINQTECTNFKTKLSEPDRKESISGYQSQKNREVVELMRHMTGTEAFNECSLGECIASYTENCVKRNFTFKSNVETLEKCSDSALENRLEQNISDYHSLHTRVNFGDIIPSNNAEASCHMINMELPMESHISTISENHDELYSIANQSGSLLMQNLEQNVEYDTSVDRSEADLGNRRNDLEITEEQDSSVVTDLENRDELNLQNGVTAFRNFEDSSTYNDSSSREHDYHQRNCPTAQEYDGFTVGSWWRDTNTRSTAVATPSRFSNGFLDNNRSCCFDSFLNIENMCQVLWKRKAWSFSRSPLNAILNHAIPAKSLPRIPVDIIGGVMVFDDPNCFPKTRHLDSTWNFSVGIHPKHAPFLTDAQFGTLSTYMQGKHSPALGSIGYDHSQCEKFWDIQNEEFCKLLGLSRPDKPIIIHIKGEEGDIFGSELHEKCLHKLQKQCPRDQKVHLHSFTGTKRDVSRWVSTFPNCYFGFSWIVEDFEADQWNAFRCVPIQRVLLETGIVHRQRHENLKTARSKIKRPAHLGELAATLASVRGMNFDPFLRQTVENGKRLYAK